MENLIKILEAIVKIAIPLFAFYITYKASPVLTDNKLRAEKIEIFKTTKEMKKSRESFEENSFLLETLFNLVTSKNLKAEYIYRAVISDSRLDFLNNFKKYRGLYIITNNRDMAINYKKIQNLYILYCWTFFTYVTTAGILIATIFGWIDTEKWLSTYYESSYLDGIIGIYLFSVFSLWLICAAQLLIIKNVEKIFIRLKNLEISMGCRQIAEDRVIDSSYTITQRIAIKTRQERYKISRGFRLTLSRHQGKLAVIAALLSIHIGIHLFIYYFFNNDSTALLSLLNVFRSSS